MREADVRPRWVSFRVPSGSVFGCRFQSVPPGTVADGQQARIEFAVHTREDRITRQAIEARYIPNQPLQFYATDPPRWLDDGILDVGRVRAMGSQSTELELGRAQGLGEWLAVSPCGENEWRLLVITEPGVRPLLVGNMHGLDVRAVGVERWLAIDLSSVGIPRIDPDRLVAAPDPRGIARISFRQQVEIRSITAGDGRKMRFHVRSVRTPDRLTETQVEVRLLDPPVDWFEVDLVGSPTPFRVRVLRATASGGPR